MPHYIAHPVVRPANLLLLIACMLVLTTMIAASASSRKSQDAKPAAAPQDAAPAKVNGGRTVLITGANRGIGLEFAKQLHAAGWKVIATAREPDKADDLKSLGKEVRLEALDVASGESVAALVKRLKDQPIDLLINNAGVSSAGSRLPDIKMEDFEHVIEVNAIGPVRVTQALLPSLKSGKGKLIVNITSGLGSIEQNRGGGQYGYRESKAALNMFTRSIAAELKRDGFICIAIHPGWVQTDMGGPRATLTPEQSITGMRKVIDGLKPEDSGKFWSYDGTNLPW